MFNANIFSGKQIPSDSKGAFMDIKNYVFDFGKVLTHFDTYDLTAAEVDDPERCKIISEAVFDRKIWDRLDDGTITDDEAKKAFLEALPENMHEDAIRVYDNWIFNLRPIEGMPEVIKELKQRGDGLYLISNISIGFAENYHKVPWINELFSMFDGLVFSGPLHITKPGEDIFRYFLKNYGLRAAECLFIDDSRINTNGANYAGIPAYVFDGDIEYLRKAVVKLRP